MKSKFNLLRTYYIAQWIVSGMVMLVMNGLMGWHCFNMLSERDESTTSFIIAVVGFVLAIASTFLYRLAEMKYEDFDREMED